MATKNKTAETEVEVRDFINGFVDNDLKKADSLRLIELMSKLSGFEPKMWGPSIIGFGKYHYKYASGHISVCLYRIGGAQASPQKFGEIQNG